MIRKDAYSIHEKLDGAKMKATIYSAPINYKDENDEWKEIVTDLDTKVNWETEYCVEKNNFKTYFNDMTDPINPTLASFEYDGKWINYKMVDAEPEEIIVDKSKILWREVKPYID